MGISPVIDRAVARYRKCANDDRTVEFGGKEAADMDDSVADMLEFINGVDLEDVRRMPERVLMTALGHAVSVAEAYLRMNSEG